MKIQKIAVYYLLFFLICKVSNAQIPIFSHSNWKYYDAGNVNNSQWNTLTFNDSAWSEGQSEFGYGDGDETTIINYGDASNKFITTYFRKNIQLENQSALVCSIKIDDGAVVYFNGQEVFRNNLPTGTIDFGTLALNNLNENAWFDFSIPANLINVGLNNISVEIHQTAPNTSDMSFDFSLSQQPLPPPNGVYINEIMASNEQAILDVNGNPSDWFEIFNNTSQALDLANYYVTDTKTNLKKFRFTSEANKVIVPAGGYKIIWANSSPQLGYDYTSFSLSSSGEFVGLIAPDGVTVIDSLTFGRSETDISIGRSVSKIDSIVYFSPSSPNIANNDVNAYKGFLDPPTYSVNGGFFNSAFNLSLNHADPGVTIVYTKDSSEPSLQNINGISYSLKNGYPQNIGEPLGPFQTRQLKSNIYNNTSIVVENANLKANDLCNLATQSFSGPFQPQNNIPKASIIRARATKTGFLQSPIATQTYFFNNTGINNYTVPIYSLNIQEDKLYEYSKGISTAGETYDNYFLTHGRDMWVGNYMQHGSLWERDHSNLELYLNNKLKFNQETTLRVHGKYSRTINKKSFRVGFSKPTSLYFEDTLKLSSKFIFKVPGVFIPMQDIAFSVAKKLNFEYQDNYPNVLYINGEYWGVYTTTDYFDDNYISSKYGISSNDINIYKDEVLDTGTDINYNNLMSFLSNNTFDNQAKFDSLSALIDIDNFTDYIISEVFINNKDWPLNNTFIWQKNVAHTKNTPLSPTDGRWRFIMVDNDDALTSAETNSLYGLYGTTGIQLIFTKMAANQAYKSKFINRFADLLNSHFSTDRTLPIYNAKLQQYLPEIAGDYLRWEKLNVSSWTNEMNKVNQFFSSRPNYQRTHILDRFGINGTYNLTVKTSNVNHGFVKINTININNETLGIVGDYKVWTGTYFDNIPLNITAVPRAGYKFNHWIYNGQILTDVSITINTALDTQYEAVFELLIFSDNPTPAAKVIANCGYQFTNWLATSAANTFPTNMKFVYFDADDPTLGSQIVGNTTGAYNFTSKTRINGNGSLGFSFINTNSSTTNTGYPNGKLGAAILAINTMGIDSMSLSWVGRTIVPNPKKYAIRLQYRVGDVQPFLDFSPPIEYQGSTVALHNSLFSNIAIPTEILNKPYVQLIWRYYWTGNGTGARDQLAVDDISISSFVKNNLAIIGQTQVIGNPNTFLLSNPIQNSSITYNANNYILFCPGFEVSTPGVFSAQIKTCP